MIGDRWGIERHVGSAAAFHARTVPSPARRTVWWFEVAQPAVALGSTQSLEVVDEELAKEAGVDVVRRRSGGGAVWLEPGADPMVSNGMQTCEVINGGRVINEISHSEMMGMPFEGHGMTGYDNFRKKYWSTWTDNMATSMMYMEGTSDDDGKTITYNTTMDDPMIGEKDQPVKFVYRWVDDDKHILESWHDVGTPKEYKMMEITYTRKQ